MLASLVFVFCGLLLPCPLLSCLLESWSQRSLGASWKPLRRLWRDLLGPPGALRGPLETDFGPLDGPWSLQGHSWACGRSWRLLGDPQRALGTSRAALGALWAAPKSLSAKKQKIVGGIAFFIVVWAPGGLLAPPGALLELSGRPLEPSWRLLGGLRGLGWLLGGFWQASVGPGWFLGGPGLVPGAWARRRTAEGPEPRAVFIV